MIDQHAHERLNKVETTLNNHTEHLTKLDTVYEQYGVTLENHGATLQDIADNTKEIVSMVKGARGLRKFIVWISPVIVAILSVIMFVRG